MAYPGYGTTTTNSPNSILASGEGAITIQVTIKSGEGELSKGQVLGVETASEKYVKYDDGAADGSEVAKAILADDVDATSGDQIVSAFIAGAFKVADLTDYDANALTDLNGRRVGPEGGATTDIIKI